MSTLADIIRTVKSSPKMSRNQLKIARAKLRRYGVSGAGMPGGQGGPLVPEHSELESQVASVLEA
jgi:hypothetical protein